MYREKVSRWAISDRKAVRKSYSIGMWSENRKKSFFSPFFMFFHSKKAVIFVN